MNEKNKLYVILGIVVAFIAIILLLSVGGLKKDKELYQKFEEAFASDKPTLVYIGRTSCNYCTLFNPTLEDMKERYGFDYLYFNIDEYSSSYFNKIVEKLELTKIGTPYLAVVGNNTTIDKITGIPENNEFFELLQKNGIISSEAKLPINYVDYDEYTELLASKEPKLIVVGQSACGFCVNAKLALNQIADKYGIEINYLSITGLNEEEQEKFKKSLDYFGTPGWGTPVMFIAQDNKMVSRYNGFTSMTDYITFLTEEGIINE